MRFANVKKQQENRGLCRDGTYPVEDVNWLCSNLTPDT
jgi:hypothetical protein